MATGKTRHWVAGALQRGGKVRLERIPAVTRETLHSFMHRNVTDEAEAIYTDELKIYLGIEDGDTRHETVIRMSGSSGRFTQTASRACARFKRSVVWASHQTSRKHLDRCVEEMEWRFNNRDNPHMFRDTVKRIPNVDALRYRELVHGRKAA